MSASDARRAKDRERKRRRRARETPAEADERRRLNRERMRARRAAAIPSSKPLDGPAPGRGGADTQAPGAGSFDPRTGLTRTPRLLRIDPRTLRPVYEGDDDPVAVARRLLRLP